MTSALPAADLYAGIVSVNVPIFDFGAQQATTRSRLAKYQAERARLSSVADDVTFEIVTIYQSIYVLSQNILSLQQEVAKADRDVQVTGSQQEEGIATPLAAIEKELHLIAKRDDLDGLRGSPADALRGPPESLGRLLEVVSMKQSQRIVKNAVVGVAAGVIGGLVYLATTIAIARNHNVSLAEFGKYQWVLAFAMIAQLVADSGLPRMMIREIAKDPECVGKITGAAAGLIWAISLVVCVVVGVIALFLTLRQRHENRGHAYDFGDFGHLSCRWLQRSPPGLRGQRAELSGLHSAKDSTPGFHPGHAPLQDWIGRFRLSPTCSRTYSCGPSTTSSFPSFTPRLS